MFSNEDMHISILSVCSLFSKHYIELMDVATSQSLCSCQSGVLITGETLIWTTEVCF